MSSTISQSHRIASLLLMMLPKFVGDVLAGGQSAEGQASQLGTQGGTGSASPSRATRGRKEANEEHPAHITYSSCQGKHQRDGSELVW